MARIVTRLQDLPGQHLCPYLDADGEPRTIGSEDVNAYPREIAGEEFTAIHPAVLLGYENGTLCLFNGNGAGDPGLDRDNPPITLSPSSHPTFMVCSFRTRSGYFPRA